MSVRPTFFLVGVPKAGTTALYHELSAHPDVFMPAEKEPHFFSCKPRPETGAPMTAAAYEALFAPHAGERAVGEASPSYFHHPDAPARIRAYAPEAHIVVSLRHPVERAFSHYLMLVNSGAAPPDGFEPLFREAIAAARRGVEPAPASGYRQSRYADALDRWYGHFPAERVTVLVHEEHRAAPEASLRHLYAVLGVDPDYRHAQVGAVRNAGRGLPKSRRLHALVFRDNPIKQAAKALVPAGVRRRAARTLLRRNATQKPRLDPALRAAFMDAFQDDVARVEARLGRPIDAWR